MIFWNEGMIFSTSALVLGVTAMFMMVSGNTGLGRVKATDSESRVSPVLVSLSLATAKMSPGPTSSTGFWALPSSMRSEPMRSLVSRVAL